MKLTLMSLALLALSSTAHGLKLDNVNSFNRPSLENPYMEKGVYGLSRMEMLEAVDQRYGFAALFCAQDDSSSDMERYCPGSSKYGMFGASALVTYREYQTGREQVPLWSMSNVSLTVEPYAYMLDLDRNVPCSQSDFIRRYGDKITAYGGSQISHLKVCEAWQDFYREGDKIAALIGQGQQISQAQKQHLQKKYWVAHSRSLLNDWLKYRQYFFALLIKREVPESEFKIWGVWSNAVVRIPARYGFSTCPSNTWGALRAGITDTVLFDERHSRIYKPRARNPEISANSLSMLTDIYMILDSASGIDDAIAAILPLAQL